MTEEMKTPTPVLSSEGIEAKLWAAHTEEHAKLGQMLADEHKTSIEVNWQGGKVNGLAAAVDIVRSTSKVSPSSKVVGPKAVLGLDPLADFDLVALDCEVSVLREDMASSPVDDCTVIHRHQLDRIASFIDLLAAVQDRWELVTHVRPSAEGDPTHYAFQVCATADEGALPVYRAALSATATEGE